MSVPKETRIVYTLEAKCRDCYRCVRVCPVKAISMKNGQAKVEPSRCISCGTCVRECPQNAKVFRDDTDAVIDLLKSGVTAVAGVAPSFAGYFEPWERQRFVSALRMAGFSRVEETASAAYAVSAAARKYFEADPDSSHICTACPASVLYAEKYHEKASSFLGIEPSPMIEHSARIRKRSDGAEAFVFFGPCIAKKAEADRPEYEGLVEAALTFIEAERLLEKLGVDLKRCEESYFDTPCFGESRLYPVAGGLVRTAYNGEIPSTALMAEGPCMTAASFDIAEERPYLVETLFCEGGCINGPGMGRETNYFERRARLLKYIQDNPAEEPGESDSGITISARFKYTGLPFARKYTADEIAAVWANTGKASPEQRLDCGMCGYDDCTAKAAAVLDGMAEPEMCVPFMRRLAEQRGDKIIETSPNGIVIVDNELKIIKMNRAFEKLFGSAGYPGRHIGDLMDPVPFESIAIGTSDSMEFTATHPERRLTCHEMYYALREDGQFVGIFVDVTRFIDNDRELDRIKKETFEKAKQLLEHQVQAAQDMALFLGENTAKTEELLSRLMKIAGGGNEKG